MSADDAVEIRLVRPDESRLLIELIRRCYGDTYIDPSFYEEGYVSALLDDGTLSSIGAFAGDSLIGHMGITLRAHGGNTADAGMTLVDPSFRGRGIAKRVAVGLAQQSIALGLVGAHDYPVTVHAATQRIGAGFGVDTGLMLANMPADVSFEGIEAAPGRRTSSLIRWLPFGRPPARDVFLPDRYHAHVQSIYSRAGLQRRHGEAVSALAPGTSQLEHGYDHRRQTLRVSVLCPRSDLAECVAKAALDAERLGGLVEHVDLSLCQPSTPVATEALRALGFFFAGVLPEYRDGDVLRMQRLSKSLEHSSGVLSPDGMSIEAFVLGDRPSGVEAAR